jgi:hypothetical protein
MARRALEAEKVDPELCETRLVESSERDLLHPENAERSRLAQ